MANLEFYKSHPMTTSQRLTRHRALLRILIEAFHNVAPDQRPLLLMRIHDLQGQLRNFYRSQHDSPDPLSWVDSWRPAYRPRNLHS
jgi:hypothetical protein